MSNESEIKNQLIDEYKMLTDLRAIAEKEGAPETVKRIEREIRFIKLKLQPLELPED